PGRGEEVPPGILGVDAELDRVPAQRRVGVPQPLAVRDAEHLPDQVQPPDLLGGRGLHLKPGIHLQDRHRAGLAAPEPPRAPPPPSPAPRMTAWDDSYSRSRWAPVRNGAGASSTSFWCRRCSEQSRVDTTTTSPCWSARHCVSTCRGRSRYRSTKHSPRP